MKHEEFETAFKAEGGSLINGNPVMGAPVFRTAAGTPYLKGPGVAVLAKTVVEPKVLDDFLNGFDPDLGFPAYLDDRPEWHPTVIERFDDGSPVFKSTGALPRDMPCSALLIKMAGQLCYLSFDAKRTMNADAVRYIYHILESGHGSVAEHAYVSILFYGISRSQTHELVRHRVGVALSQVSQRYVDGTKLRFVERPEYQNDPELHAMFEEEIDRQAALYDKIANTLISRQKGGDSILSGDAARDRRKKVNQTARSVLGNHAEAPILVTGNVRAWRHMINMRTATGAETEIRRTFYRAFLCNAVMDPICFCDCDIVDNPDGIKGVRLQFPKV